MLLINAETMLKLAKKAIRDAPNKDWKNRGCILVGDSHSVDVKTYDHKQLGVATVAYFKFEKPLRDKFEPKGISPFVGFTLAAMDVKGKLIYQANCVIGKISDKNYHDNYLANRFCPQCQALDSITRKSKMMGPECALITYKCNQCSYRDEDVMD